MLIQLNLFEVGAGPREFLERKFELIDVTRQPKDDLFVCLDLFKEGSVLLLHRLHLILDQGADAVLKGKPLHRCRGRGLVSEHLGSVVDHCGAFRLHNGALPSERVIFGGLRH